MSSRLELFVGLLTLISIVFILELVRRRQLREKYALLWLAVGAVVLVVGLSPSLLDRISGALGIEYGPSTLFLFSILFLVLVVAHLSWEISRLEEKTRRLAEEVALLRVRRPDRDRTLDIPA